MFDRVSVEDRRGGVSRELDACGIDCHIDCSCGIDTSLCLKKK